MATLSPKRCADTLAFTAIDFEQLGHPDLARLCRLREREVLAMMGAEPVETLPDQRKAAQ